MSDIAEKLEVALRTLASYRQELQDVRRGLDDLRDTMRRSHASLEERLLTEVSREDDFEERMGARVSAVETVTTLALDRLTLALDKLATAHQEVATEVRGHRADFARHDEMERATHAKMQSVLGDK